MPSLDMAKWLYRIGEAERFQAERHSTWKMSLSLYDMSYWRKLGYTQLTIDQMIPVNYITTFVSTLVSSVYSRNPKIFVRGRYDRFARFAETMEDLLERYWDEQDLKQVFIEVIRDATIFGIGWVECGFLPERVRELPKPEVAEQAGVVDRLKEVIQQLTGKEEQAPEPVSTQGILNVKQQAGSFYCLRRSPYDVLWPPGYHSFSSLPYLILRDRLAFEDFEADPRYTNKEAIQQESRKTNRDARFVRADFDNVKDSLSGTSANTDQKTVEVFHIWDRREMSVSAISRKSPLPHIAPHDWPYFAEGFPVMPLLFNGIPDLPDDAKAYPYGDVEPIIGQALEKSAIRTAAQQHRKRSNTVVFVQKGGTTESEIANYARNSGALMVIPVTNIEAIKLGPQIPIPESFFRMEEMVNADMDRDSGLQLILADLARTGQIDRATVATIAQGNASLKTNYKVDRVEMYAKQIARYTAGLFWQYMTRQKVGKLIGLLPDQDQWPELPADPNEARDRIHQVLEFRIEAGSTRPIQDDVLDREQFLRYIRIFQAVSPQKFAQVENQLLALMAKKFREPSLEAVIQQSINQDHAKEAEQENQLLLQGHPQLVRESDDHDAHIPVHAQAAVSPVHKMQAEQAAAQGQAHPLDSHLLQHVQMQQGRQAVSQGQSRNRQGVDQQSAAPSATEITHGGMPNATDLGGRPMNLGIGSGAESVGL